MTKTKVLTASIKNQLTATAATIYVIYILSCITFITSLKSGNLLSAIFDIFVLIPVLFPIFIYIGMFMFTKKLDIKTRLFITAQVSISCFLLTQIIPGFITIASKYIPWMTAGINQSITDWITFVLSVMLATVALYIINTTKNYEKIFQTGLIYVVFLAITLHIATTVVNDSWILSIASSTPQGITPLLIATILIVHILPIAIYTMYLIAGNLMLHNLNRLDRMFVSAMTVAIAIVIVSSFSLLQYSQLPLLLQSWVPIDDNGIIFACAAYLTSTVLFVINTINFRTRNIK